MDSGHMPDSHHTPAFDKDDYEQICGNCGLFKGAHEIDEDDLICPRPGTRFANHTPDGVTLLPCPFCGEPEFIRIAADSIGALAVICSRCGADGPGCAVAFDVTDDRAREEAARLWNMRAADTRSIPDAPLAESPPAATRGG